MPLNAHINHKVILNHTLNKVYIFMLWIKSFVFNYSFKGLQKVVKMLIDKGANVNIEDNESNSALMFAAYGGNDLI